MSEVDLKPIYNLFDRLCGRQAKKEQIDFIVNYLDENLLGNRTYLHDVSRILVQCALLIGKDLKLARKISRTYRKLLASHADAYDEYIQLGEVIAVMSDMHMQYLPALPGGSMQFRPFAIDLPFSPQGTLVPKVLSVKLSTFDEFMNLRTFWLHVFGDAVSPKAGGSHTQHPKCDQWVHIIEAMLDSGGMSDSVAHVSVLCQAATMALSSKNVAHDFPTKLMINVVRTVRQCYGTLNEGTNGIASDDSRKGQDAIATEASLPHSFAEVLTSFDRFFREIVLVSRNSVGLRVINTLMQTLQMVTQSTTRGHMKMKADFTYCLLQKLRSCYLIHTDSSVDVSDLIPFCIDNHSTQIVVLIAVHRACRMSTFDWGRFISNVANRTHRNGANGDHIPAIGGLGKPAVASASKSSSMGTRVCKKARFEELESVELVDQDLNTSMDVAEAQLGGDNGGVDRVDTVDGYRGGAVAAGSRGADISIIREATTGEMYDDGRSRKADGSRGGPHMLKGQHNQRTNLNADKMIYWNTSVSPTSVAVDDDVSTRSHSDTLFVDSLITSTLKFIGVCPHVGVHTQADRDATVPITETYSCATLFTILTVLAVGATRLDELPTQIVREWAESMNRVLTICSKICDDIELKMATGNTSFDDTFSKSEGENAQQLLLLAVMHAESFAGDMIMRYASSWDNLLIRMLTATQHVCFRGPGERVYQNDNHIKIHSQSDMLVSVRADMRGSYRHIVEIGVLSSLGFRSDLWMRLYTRLSARVNLNTNTSPEAESAVCNAHDDRRQLKKRLEDYKDGFRTLEHVTIAKIMCDLCIERVNNYLVRDITSDPTPDRVTYIANVIAFAINTAHQSLRSAGITVAYSLHEDVWVSLTAFIAGLHPFLQLVYRTQESAYENVRGQLPPYLIALISKGSLEHNPEAHGISGTRALSSWNILKAQYFCRSKISGTQVGISIGGSQVQSSQRMNMDIDADRNCGSETELIDTDTLQKIQALLVPFAKTFVKDLESLCIPSSKQTRDSSWLDEHSESTLDTSNTPETVESTRKSTRMPALHKLEFCLQVHILLAAFQEIHMDEAADALIRQLDHIFDAVLRTSTEYLQSCHPTRRKLSEFFCARLQYHSCRRMNENRSHGSSAHCPNASDVHLFHCLRAGEIGHGLPQIFVYAYTQFIITGSYVNPSSSVYALKAITEAWQAATEDQEQGPSVSYLITAELGEVGKTNTLTFLMLAQTQAIFDEIILPLARRASSNPAAAIVLQQLKYILYTHCGERFPQFFEHRFLAFVSLDIIMNKRAWPNQQPSTILESLFKRLHMRKVHSLFDSDAVYHVMTSTYIQRHTEEELVRGKLFGILQNVADILRVPVYDGSPSSQERDALFHTTNADMPNFIRPEHLEKSLLPLIWDLGSDDAAREVATKALKVLGSLARAERWSTMVSEADIQIALSTLMSKSFLYVMSNLIQHGKKRDESSITWEEKTPRQQVQSVWALKAIVGMLPTDDLSKLLPKVMIIVDKTLGSRVAELRLAAVELASSLVALLPDASLGTILTALIIGLYPIIENEYDMHDNDAATITSDVMHIGKIPDVGFIPSSRLIATLSSSLPIEVQSLMKVPNTVPLNRQWSTQARVKAMRLLSDLARSRRDIVTESLRIVNHIPRCPELTELRALVNRRDIRNSLEEEIKLLQAAFKHESVNVRITALKKMQKICKNARKGIYLLICQGEYTSVSQRSNFVFELIHDLMKLCARESDPNALTECAKCLGQLGAVDPARMNTITLGDDSTSRSTHHSAKSASPPLPWQYDVLEMGMTLLRDHLVPSLKAAEVTQDRTGYAIQECMRRLAEVATAGSAGLNTSVGTDPHAPMPSKLKTALVDADVYDVVKLFWNTRYHLADKRRVVPTPLFDVHLPFQRWIGLWVRFLGTRCADRPAFGLYTACKGAVRTRAELSQYLLPYVVVDVLLGSVGDEGHRILVEEIRLVLSGGESEEDMQMLEQEKNGSTRISSESDVPGSHMAAQAVFELLDTLTLWTARQVGKPNERDKNADELAGSSSRSSAILHVCSAREVGKAKEAIRKLLEDIPKELLGSASLRIKAYARALRYFEYESRSVHRNLRLRKSKPSKAQSSGSENDAVNASCFTRRNDGSNSELPTLDVKDLDRHMTIYYKLEDADALQGVQRLRQINGYPSTPWSRILELEQTENWLNALLEYGLLHNAVLATTSDTSSILINADGCSSGVKSATKSSSATTPSSAPGSRISRSLLPSLRKDSVTDSRTARRKRRASLGKSSGSNNAASSTPVRPMAIVSMNVGGDGIGSAGVVGASVIDLVHSEDERDDLCDLSAGNDSGDDDEVIDALAEVERGRLRCLIELGHLDSVVDQTFGMIQRVPALEKALVPLGIEASWRLNNWTDLDEFLNRIQDPSTNEFSLNGHTQRDEDTEKNSKCLSLSPFFITDVHEPKPYLPAARISVAPEDGFQVSLGKILCSLHQQDRTHFEKSLLLARKETVLSLAAASKESYGRAYPYITRLHILHEIEEGFSLLTSPNGATKSASERMRELDSYMWNERVNMMAPSHRQRSLTLAVRRSLLGMANLPSLVAQNWLGLSAAMRKIGRFESARVALRNAELCGLGADSDHTTLIQECQILKESGEINKALMLLEPVEYDIKELERQLLPSLRLELSTERKTDSNGQPRDTARDMASVLKSVGITIGREKFAERLHLATQLMVECGHKHGNAIIERYSLITQLHKDNESVFYEMGRYLETLYHDAKAREDRDREYTKPTSQSGTGKDDAGAEQAKFQSHKYIAKAIRRYIKCLQLTDHNTKTIPKALPRMLTLWFSITSLRPPEAASSTSTTGNSYAVALAGVQKEICRLMTHASETVSEAIWFCCMPQLVSRLGHPYEGTRKGIQTLLCRILVAYPRQGIWHVAGLLRSFNSQKRAIGMEVLRKTKNTLLRDPSKKVDADMLDHSTTLFGDLIKLAAHHTNERQLTYVIGGSIPKEQLSSFLVPSQVSLTTANSLINPPARSEGTSYYTSSEMYIAHFVDTVDVASSKAKPKSILLLTTCGTMVKFLCKQEKNGDLRKDARLMDFNHVVNQLMLAEPDGRRRNLRLRTFAVVCLNEECGILEWVNNTACMRHLVLESYQYFSSKEFTNPHNRVLYDKFQRIQQHLEYDFDSLLADYNEHFANTIKPCFHRWFLEAFSDPTRWLESRKAFTHSAAVWSAVGHVVGLGDRHTENILLDTSSGECVHVDFDCLFDKGLGLARPEIVPFRLTPNIVDAMGVMGTEGPYRRCMEVCVKLLRENKDALLGVLEPFLRDPTVAWGRTGRAQRNDSEANARAGAYQDQENADAKAALEKISGRLTGIYNLIHPHADKIILGHEKKGRAPPTKGMCAAQGELSLSVSGQVQRLIEEATNVENLCQMYVGWCPWL